MKEIQFRKKREIGDIITDSFGFLKQEIKPLSQLFLVYILPFIILYAVIQVYVQMKIMGNVDLSNPEDILSKFGPIYSNIFFSMVFGIFVQSLVIGTFYSYIEAYVKKGKGNFSLSEIKPFLFVNSLQSLGANLILVFLVMLGLIMCVLPGIYLANTFSILLIILIFEKKGIGDAFTRSWNLVNLQWWNTLLLNIVALVIIWLISMILSIPAMIAGISNTFFSLKETGTVQYPEWYWILIGVSTAVTAILYVIPYTFMAFQYFNLDERTKPAKPIEGSNI